MKSFSILMTLVLSMTCGIIEFLFPVEYPQRYIERDIKEDELIGTWKITADTETRIKDYFQDRDKFWPVSPTPWKSITLYQDNSCEAEIEFLWVSESDVFKEDAVLTCTWEIDKVHGYDEIGQSKYVFGLSFSFENYNKQEDKYYMYSPDAYIFEENNELIVWNFIGMPDNLSYQEFKKVK
ncbi:MAG: hypothetical protein KF758_08090 [Anaerolineales bacterium]|nr:hypothetical protein [Anaerolineales bacterium]